MADQMDMDQQNAPGLRYALGSILFLTSMFFMNFLGRIVLAPLMPTIETDLGMGHTGAGILFFMITLGYCVSLLLQGFVAQALTHRWTVVSSTGMVGLSMFIIGLSEHIVGIWAGLVLLGVAAGLYLPSGIATLTTLVGTKSWGRALGVHELAPNLSFLSAPLVAELLLNWMSWRGVIITIGLSSLALSVAYSLWGKGGRFRGQAPDLSAVGLLARLPSFWVMVYLMSLGIAGSMGVFNMLPLFLVDVHEMSRPEANYLVSISRLAGGAAAFMAGWATDILGPKRALAMVLSGSGLATLVLSQIHGGLLVFIVFAQPMFAVCFFPPAFAAVSLITPTHARNLALAFSVALGFVLGGGALPTLMGYLGELGHFPWGLAITGIMILSGLICLPFLRLNPGQAEG